MCLHASKFKDLWTCLDEIFRTDGHWAEFWLQVPQTPRNGPGREKNFPNFYQLSCCLTHMGLFNTMHFALLRLGCAHVLNGSFLVQERNCALILVLMPQSLMQDSTLQLWFTAWNVQCLTNWRVTKFDAVIHLGQGKILWSSLHSQPRKHGHWQPLSTTAQFHAF